MRRRVGGGRGRSCERLPEMERMIGMRKCQRQGFEIYETKAGGEAVC